MADTKHKDSQAFDALTEKLDQMHAGMLAVDGSEGHMRPMSPFPEMGSGVLWFITSKDTDLIREIGLGATGHFCLIDESDGFYANLRGTIEQVTDEAKLDELWDSIAAAWFEGRDDPNLQLVKMTLRDAEVWRATDSKLQFGIEIARANLDPEHEPEIDTQDVIKF